MASVVSKPISIPGDEFSDNDPSSRVARKFINEVKDTIVTLQRVVKSRISLNVNNWSSTVHQEVHTILKDEIAPNVNQVDARVINFEKQILKEEAIFVQDFKSLANKADESLDMNEVLEYENRASLESSSSNEMQQQIEQLQAQLGDLKGKTMNTQCASNILDSLSQKLDDENVSLEFQVMSLEKENEHLKLRSPLYGKFSKQKDAMKGTSVNTKFAKPSILGKLLLQFVRNQSAVKQPRVESTAKTKRPQSRSNTKNDRNDKSKVVCAMCKQCLITANHDVCVLNYVNGMNSYVNNQSANVSNTANQKKHKEKVRKSKKLGSKERLASPRPRKSRTCLRWSPTGRIFYLSGKLIIFGDSECKFDTSASDTASASKLHKAKSQRFPNSTSFLGMLSKFVYGVSTQASPSI
ncbi:hypothetical protein Tco_0985702 [Tanacetum coccineum]